MIQQPAWKVDWLVRMLPPHPPSPAPAYPQGVQIRDAGSGSCPATSFSIAFTVLQIGRIPAHLGTYRDSHVCSRRRPPRRRGIAALPFRDRLGDQHPVAGPFRGSPGPTHHFLRPAVGASFRRITVSPGRHAVQPLPADAAPQPPIYRGAQPDGRPHCHRLPAVTSVFHHVLLLEPCAPP